MPDLNTNEGAPQPEVTPRRRHETITASKWARSISERHEAALALLDPEERRVIEAALRAARDVGPLEDMVRRLDDELKAKRMRLSVLREEAVRIDDFRALLDRIVASRGAP